MSSSHAPLRRVAIAASAVVAVGATTAGINIVSAADEPVPADAAVVTAIGPLPAGAAVTRNPAVPAGEQMTAIAAARRAERLKREKIRKEKLRKAALRRAAEARAAADRMARLRAARSAQRTFSGDPRAIARAIAQQQYGWGAGQFACLNSLWAKESGWNSRASNSSSGAYGIPQALPGSKMAAFGADWRTNPATQIKWGLNYIDGRYGSPCSAWSTAQSRGWY